MRPLCVFVLMGLASTLWLDPQESAPALLHQPGDNAASVGAGTKFFFLAHHKTGTNIMHDMCTAMAQVLSQGREECVWCGRLYGLTPNGTLNCPYFRGHLPRDGRFILVTRLNASDFRDLQAYEPDYRAIHMVRNPLDMIVSDYQYNKRMIEHVDPDSPNWDCTQDRRTFLALSVTDRLRNISQSLTSVVLNMCSLQQATQGDPRVQEIDLASFQQDFAGESRRLLTFLLGADNSRLEEVIRYTVRRFDAETNPHIASNIIFSDPGEREEVAGQLQRLLEAGDEPLLSASTSCRGAAAAAEAACVNGCSGPAVQMAHEAEALRRARHW